MRSDLQNLEPLALGRYAFWQGRPIAVNPLVGVAAREWAVGWRRGLTELISRVPADQPDVQTLSTASLGRLLRAYCPPDIPIAMQQPQPGRMPAARAAAGAGVRAAR
jgi:hypothetical protein